jgi:hypothetical protein
MSLPYQYRRSSCVLLLAITSLGCGNADKIESYTVDKQPRPAETRPAGEVAATTANNPATPAGSATDRMLAAILPDGQRAWFFKVVGSAIAVDKHADELAEFFASIRPAGNEPLPTWKLPADWTQQPGNEFRAATIVIPGEKPLELTVSTLPWTGSQEQLLSNINRWRGQLQLPPIEAEQLAATTHAVKAGDATMTVVDLAGRFQSGGMTPPFAGGARFAGGGDVGAASRASQDETPRDLPAGHPPIGPPTGSAGTRATAPDNVAKPEDAVPGFDLPKSWRVLPAEGMRRAAFSVADGSKQAIITVIELSAKAPRVADTLDNVNRWRGEVGLARVEKDSLGKVTESMKIGGQDATYMAAIPDASKPEESQIPRATLAAMVPDGERIWFFKMTGARELVAAEQQHFKDFLKSVRFTGDRGATDGN